MDKIINLSLTRKNVPTRIDWVQYATSPNIVFVLDDYVPASGAKANLYIEKPDGMEIYNSCTISGNQVTYKPTTQSFAAVGTNKCQLQITEANGTAISFIIYADVTENIIDSDAIESTDEFTALEEALQQVGELTTLGERITAAENILDKVDSIEKGTIATGTDLNSLSVMGIYNVNANSALVNAPTTAAGVLKVFRPTTTGRSVQLYYTVSSMYFRVYSGASWSAWTEIPSGINTVLASGGVPDNTINALPSGQWTTIGNFTLPSAGMYLVTTFVQFPANANGIRGHMLSSNGNNDNTGSLSATTTEYQNAINGYFTTCRITGIVNKTTSGAQAYYLKAYQNSGSQLTAAPRIHIIKIR